jgi:hypothetical protein
MNNSNSTDTSKTPGQPASFADKSETKVDSQPAKVEEPKTETVGPIAGEPKPSTDDAEGKSLR